MKCGCGLEYKTKKELDAHYMGHQEERRAIQRVMDKVMLKYADAEGDFIE